MVAAQLARSFGDVCIFGVLENHLLAFDPEADSFEHLVFLRHIQILVLEQQLEIVLGQVSELGVGQQERKVLAYEA